jgi:glycosyltransferase involved in cell wall biosynthesis
MPSRPATAFQPTERSPLVGRTILQIIPALEAGGAERTTVDIADGLVGVGARALVACEGGRLIGELQAKGGVWLEFPAATKNPLAMLANARRLARLIQSHRVDLVHARSRAPAWVALAACRMTGTPFVTTYHGSYKGRSGPKVLYNSVMARGDVVIANSAYTAGQIAAQYPSSAPRIRVIQRGTDMSLFARVVVAPERVAALREAWRIGPHERVVLLPGRLTEWKGQRVLIEAARLLADKGLKDLVFVLAGDPQGREAYVKELDALAAERGVSGVVRRVGHVADVPAALMASAVVTVPSTEPEAFGRVAVEAQAMGVPVVVADHGAVPETVLAPPQVGPEARTGWRVPPGDAAALAQAIHAALSLRPSARDALAERARDFVENNLGLERMVEATLDVYAAVLETAGRR